MTIAKADLGPLEEIAAGAFGVVYRAPAFDLGGEAVAYKEFTTDHAAQARTAAVVVDFWDGLVPDDRASLAPHVAWPLALVHDRSGQVCGLLMPVLGPEFFCRRLDPMTGATRETPRAMEWLIATAAQRTTAQVDVPDIDRVDRHVLLAKLTYAIGRLHRLGWVYGDLSFKNAVFALDPPRIKLLDCDGAAPLADLTRDQSHTPFWQPPEYKTNPKLLQDERSDVYKLGLAIIRCLTPGKGAGSSQDPARIVGALDAVGEDLIRAALHGDRQQRPRAKDLYVYFERLLRSRITPPVIRHASLGTPIRLRGQDIAVEWEIEGADEIVVEAANGQRLAVDPQALPTGVSFRPDASGPVVVEARNRFGTVWEELGEVTLYELPRFKIDRVDLPRPGFTPLAPVALTTASAVLDTRPLSHVGTSVNALPSPDLGALIGATAPVGQRLPALPQLHAPVADASDAVSGSVRQGGIDLASRIHQVIADASLHATNGGRTT